MIVLPLFLQMTLEYNAMQAGLSPLAPLSLSMFGMAVLAGRKAGKCARLTSSWRDSPSAPSAWPQSFLWCLSGLGMVSGDPAADHRLGAQA